MGRPGQRRRLPGRRRVLPAVTAPSRSIPRPGRAGAPGVASPAAASVARPRRRLGQVGGVGLAVLRGPPAGVLLVDFLADRPRPSVRCGFRLPSTDVAALAARGERPTTIAQVLAAREAIARWRGDAADAAAASAVRDAWPAPTGPVPLRPGDAAITHHRRSATRAALLATSACVLAAGALAGGRVDAARRPGRRPRRRRHARRRRARSAPPRPRPSPRSTARRRRLPPPRLAVAGPVLHTSAARTDRAARSYVRIFSRCGSNTTRPCARARSTRNGTTPSTRLQTSPRSRSGPAMLPRKGPSDQPASSDARDRPAHGFGLPGHERTARRGDRHRWNVSRRCAGGPGRASRRRVDGAGEPGIRHAAALA